VVLFPSNETLIILFSLKNLISVSSSTLTIISPLKFQVSVKVGVEMTTVGVGIMLLGVIVIGLFVTPGEGMNSGVD
jgi:hypothetical protein